MDAFDLKKYKHRILHQSRVPRYFYLVLGIDSAIAWKCTNQDDVVLTTDGILLKRKYWHTLLNKDYQFKSKQALMKVLRANYGRIRVSEYKDN